MAALNVASDPLGGRQSASTEIPLDTLGVVRSPGRSSTSRSPTAGACAGALPPLIERPFMETKFAGLSLDPFESPPVVEKPLDLVPPLVVADKGTINRFLPKAVFAYYSIKRPTFTAEPVRIPPVPAKPDDPLITFSDTESENSVPSLDYHRLAAPKEPVPRKPEAVHNAWFGLQRLKRRARKAFEMAVNLVGGEEETEEDQELLEAVVEARELVAEAETQFHVVGGLNRAASTISECTEPIVTSNRFAALDVDIEGTFPTQESATSVRASDTPEVCVSEVKVNRKRKIPERKLTNRGDYNNILYAEGEDRPVYFEASEEIELPEIPVRYQAVRPVVEADLYQTLLQEALFLPRKPGLFRQLKLKAKQFWSGFDTSDFTQAEITEKTANAITAVMIPSKHEVRCMKALSHSGPTELRTCWNDFIENLNPMGIIERLRRKVSREINSALERLEANVAETLDELCEEYANEVNRSLLSEENLLEKLTSALGTSDPADLEAMVGAFERPLTRNQAQLAEWWKQYDRMISSRAHAYGAFGACT